MKESDIRPDELLIEVSNYHDEDVKDIMQYKDQFVKVSCPCCGEPYSDFQFEKEGFIFEKCTKCRTLYINPRPTIEILSDFYSNSKSMNYWNNILFPQTEKYRRQSLFKNRALKIIEICTKYRSDFKTLVDVGAGFGTFCEVIQEKNVFQKVIAVEPSVGLARSCKEKGIYTISQPIEKVYLEEVSVITNFEVIEHLFNPLDFVKSCVKALPKDGLFVVTTPNIEGFELSMLKANSANIAGPEHLNYFTPSSLKYLLEKCGLEVLEIATPGKLDAELVRKEILNGGLPTEIDSFLYQILIDKWDDLAEPFQKFLEDNKLSSHMWAIARKK